MSITRRELLQAAMELPEADRFELANELFASVSEPPPGWSIHAPDFLDELRRRESEGDEGVLWEDVRRQLRKGS